MHGEGQLLPEYYQAWADYHLRFLQAYEDAGVLMWGLTAQNEPVDGNIPDFSFNCMGWNASSQATWIGKNLGPTLEQNGYGHLKLMAFDDQRPLLFGWSQDIMADEEAAGEWMIMKMIVVINIMMIMQATLMGGLYTGTQTS